MKRNWLKTILTSGLCLAMLTACGGGGNSSAEKTVVANLSSEPPEMLSFLCTDSTSGNVLRHVMEGLVTLDENNEAIPGVAKEVPTKENGGISEDGKTITFKLNPDAKWSDGTQVTAGDFEFAWDQLFYPTNGAAYASTWSPLIVGADELLNADQKDQAKIDAALANKGWHALDDETFEVQLTGPYVYFVNLMSFYNFAPLQKTAYENGGGLDKYANDMSDFLGNGPFKFAEWNHDNNIVLVKNDQYWNADSIKIDKIDFKMISDTNTALNEFENGTIDMIGLTGEQANKLADDGKNVQNYADGSVWYLEFNTKVKGLNNAKVRKALSLGYDVDQFIEKVKGDQSTAATCFTAPSTNNGEFSKSLGNLIVRSSDYTEAKKLLEEGLAEEGLTVDTFKVSLLGDTGDDALKIYSYFQEQWRQNLGLSVEINQVEFKTRIANMQSHDFDIVFAGWSADYDDPMSYLDLWLTGGGNNHGEYSNPDYDKVIQAALVEVDAAKRTEYLKQAEQILATDYPVGTIYHRQKSYICSDKLTGVVRTAFSDIDLRFAEVK